MPWIDGTYLRWFPSLTWQCQAKTAALVRAASPGARIVDLGAGGRQIRADVISVDWAPLAHTRVIADVQRLPFKSGSVALALATGLLEHVEDERAVLREMQRVLQPGGLAHLEAPLLQPEHRDPIDCRRFTVDGLARAAVRAGLTPTDSGFHIGPTVAVLTLLAHYLATWFDGQHPVFKTMSAAVFLVCSIVFFPFKYLDRCLVHRVGAQRLAFGVYCTARKPSVERPDRV